MKSRTIPFRDGPYAGHVATISREWDKKWEPYIETPHGRYRVLFNLPPEKGGNPIGLERVGPADIVVAERYGPVVVARDGTTWTEGEDVSGGWVCTTEAAGCGRMEAR